MESLKPTVAVSISVSILSWIRVNGDSINLPVLETDVPRCGAKIPEVGREGFSLPVDDQTPGRARESGHGQVEDVVWCRYLVGRHSCSRPLKHWNHRVRQEAPPSGLEAPS